LVNKKRCYKDLKVKMHICEEYFRDYYKPRKKTIAIDFHCPTHFVFSKIKMAM